MTLNEAAYNLLNILRGGRSTTSDVLSLEQIKFNILYYRALILRRDAERKRNLGAFEQTVPVAMDLVTPPFPSPSSSLFNETFFRGGKQPFALSGSVRTLPTILRLQDGEAVLHVGDLYGGGSYPYTSAERVASQFHGRYTGVHKRSFVLGDRLFVVNPTPETGEDVVTLRAVFEDPRQAHDFGFEEAAEMHAGGYERWDDDQTRFPCSLDVYQRITQSLLSGEYRVLRQSDNDISLNQHQ